MAEPKSRSAISKNNKRKGNLLEINVAKDMRNIGFAFAKTTRNVSKMLDDCQIDIANVPYNIQTKSGYEKNRPKPDKVFDDMDENLKKNFPPTDAVHHHPKILVHKLPGNRTFATIDYTFLLTLLRIKHEYDLMKS